jgi:mono/diheme cytochrome c family protein
MGAEPAADLLFTAEQSSLGQQLYEQKCGGCHAPDLGEGSHGPALRGEHFWATWADKSARELYGRILSTMPSGDPGSLSQRQVLALTAFILATNGYPAGATSLDSPAQLDTVKITKAAP